MQTLGCRMKIDLLYYTAVISYNYCLNASGLLFVPCLIAFNRILHRPMFTWFSRIEYERYFN